MTEIFKIKGGNSLNGTVVPVPNKNAILAVLPACLLTNEDVTYKNLPKTTDVVKLLEILRKLGASVDDSDYENVVINCSKVNSYVVDEELGHVIRASITFAGPLLARFGRAKIPLPGGCVLGKRSIASHIDAFKKVGVTTVISEGWAEFRAPKNVLAEYIIWMVESSVTATENLLMYCSGVSAMFHITDAASEPHIQQLLNLLTEMGVSILGKGSNRLSVQGKDNLRGGCFKPDPDFVDVADLIAATGLTHGRITLVGCNDYENFGGIIQSFEKFNVKIEPVGQDLLIDGTDDTIIDVENSGFPLAGDELPKFSPRPWPGFPVDCLPSIIALSCKLNGRILIQNWMYESGLTYANELNEMGANIFISDPQRIIVSGPCRFKGGKVTAPDIIQGCKSLFLAALADPVETILINAEVLRRRYPDILNVYNSLGSDISLMS
jgi:UDP-N-acetylglucosamine 1-carboxyvinyltransferase